MHGSEDDQIAKRQNFEWLASYIVGESDDDDDSDPFEDLD